MESLAYYSSIGRKCFLVYFFRLLVVWSFHLILSRLLSVDSG